MEVSTPGKEAGQLNKSFSKASSLEVHLSDDPREWEKAMATHSSTLDWKIPRMEPGRLKSMGLLRVRHN